MVLYNKACSLFTTVNIAEGKAEIIQQTNLKVGCEPFPTKLLQSKWGKKQMYRYVCL